MENNNNKRVKKDRILHVLADVNESDELRIIRRKGDRDSTCVSWRWEGEELRINTRKA